MDGRVNDPNWLLGECVPGLAVGLGFVLGVDLGSDLDSGPCSAPTLVCPLSPSPFLSPFVLAVHGLLLRAPSCVAPLVPTQPASPRLSSWPSPPFASSPLVLRFASAWQAPPLACFAARRVSPQHLWRTPRRSSFLASPPRTPLLLRPDSRELHVLLALHAPDSEQEGHQCRLQRSCRRPTGRLRPRSGSPLSLALEIVRTDRGQSLFPQVP